MSEVRGPDPSSLEALRKFTQSPFKGFYRLRVVYDDTGNSQLKADSILTVWWKSHFADEDKERYSYRKERVEEAITKLFGAGSTNVPPPEHVWRALKKLGKQVSRRPPYEYGQAITSELLTELKKYGPDTPQEFKWLDTPLQLYYDRGGIIIQNIDSKEIVTMGEISKKITFPKGATQQDKNRYREWMRFGLASLAAVQEPQSTMITEKVETQLHQESVRNILKHTTLNPHLFYHNEKAYYIWSRGDKVYIQDKESWEHDQSLSVTSKNILVGSINVTNRTCNVPYFAGSDLSKELFLEGLRRFIYDPPLKYGLQTKEISLSEKNKGFLSPHLIYIDDVRKYNSSAPFTFYYNGVKYALWFDEEKKYLCVQKFLSRKYAQEHRCPEPARDLLTIQLQEISGKYAIKSVSTTVDGNADARQSEEHFTWAIAGLMCFTHSPPDTISPLSK